MAGDSIPYYRRYARSGQFLNSSTKDRRYSHTRLRKPGGYPTHSGKRPNSSRNGGQNASPPNTPREAHPGQFLNSAIKELTTAMKEIQTRLQHLENRAPTHSEYNYHHGHMAATQGLSGPPRIRKIPSGHDRNTKPPQDNTAHPQTNDIPSLLDLKLNPPHNVAPQGRNRQIPPLLDYNVNYPRHSLVPPTTTAEHSTNPDFKEMTYLGMQFISLQHHKHNWTQCPKGVSSSVDRLLGNINPPLKDNMLRADLEQLAIDTKRSITQVVQRHIERQEHHNLAATSRCSHADQHLINQTIKRKILNRQDNKITPTTVNEALEKRLQLFQNPTPLPTTTSTPNATNEPMGEHVDNPQHPLTPQRTAHTSSCHAPSTNPHHTHVMDTDPSPTQLEQTCKKRPKINNPEKSPPTTRKTKAPHPSHSPNFEATLQAAAALAAEASHNHPHPTPQKQNTIPHVITKGTRSRTWHLRDINPHTKTLVIADSNGKAYQEVSNFPHHTQILAFSGLKIPDIQDLLDNADDKKTLKNIKTIVIAVGVNNRGDDHLTPLSDAMLSIRHWASHRNLDLFWTGIPPFPTPPEPMRRTISDLNTIAASIFQQNYVPAISPENVQPAPWDMSGIHYTPATAQIILNSIIDHLN